MLDKYVEVDREEKNQIASSGPYLLKILLLNNLKLYIQYIYNEHAYNKLPVITK